MVRIIWSDRAALVKEEILEYGYMEFGAYSAKKLYERILQVQDLLELFPLSGKRELLLAGFERDYRSIVFHAHYKLIYYFDELTATVHISDIWDTRRSPRNLQQGIKAGS